MADKNKKGYNPKGIFGPEGFFGRMIDEQNAKQRAKKIEQNRKLFLDLILINQQILLEECLRIKNLLHLKEH